MTNITVTIMLFIFGFFVFYGVISFADDVKRSRKFKKAVKTEIQIELLSLVAFLFLLISVVTGAITIYQFTVHLKFHWFLFAMCVFCLIIGISLQRFIVFNSKKNKHD